VSGGEKLSDAEWQTLNDAAEILERLDYHAESEAVARIAEYEA
jgi:hypothetical protein